MPIFRLRFFLKRKSVCRPAQLRLDCVHMKVPLGSCNGVKLEGKVLSLYCSGVFNITYSLFGIGTSASRDHGCIITPLSCSYVPLSRSLWFLLKGGKTYPEIKDDCRTVADCCEGFFLFYRMKGKFPNPPLSALPAVARPSLLLDSGRFMLPPPSLQPFWL